ncbi:MAG: YebC/PmpR family DNA-binding transcriptional regulator [Candidatus Colwellbacteria bacterium]|nr:YebC/PmpR family DNA-binding transcriptional regulator [Candidatus Colwellbacteria bacterium]
MSGHSKWKQIKHKKGAADLARGRLFSKLANVITIAAREGADPQFNPTLRATIETARKNQMPQANIERAIKRARERGDLEELLIEAYGPEGLGILIEAITDNRNRTINEIKSLFKDYDTKLANPGSLLWSFEKAGEGYRPKFAPTVSEGAREKIKNLIGELQERDDVKEVYAAAEL